MRFYVHDAYVHAITYEDVMFMNVFSSQENRSLTDAGKLNPGLMLRNSALFPLGMIVARIPV